MAVTVRLFRVTAPHFCAAFETGDHNFIFNAAPILRWANGRRFTWFRDVYCVNKNWTIEEVETSREPARP